jgi:hypothetical protein
MPGSLHIHRPTRPHRRLRAERRGHARGER